MYEFRLSVYAPNGNRACAAFRVESEMVLSLCLDPIDICTDNLTAMIVGSPTIQTASRITHDRERLAQHISKQLTGKIMELLSQQDTVNGYAQEVPKSQP